MGKRATRMDARVKMVVVMVVRVSWRGFMHGWVGETRGWSHKEKENYGDQYQEPQEKKKGACGWRGRALHHGCKERYDGIIFVIVGKGY